jgi:hypothetical protein
VVLVGATTALIRQRVQQGEMEETIPDDVTMYDKTAEEDDDDDKETNDSAENLNLLHLLYTIAQVARGGAR